MSVSLANIRYVYLLGIGGIGMSALARYFKAAGRRVCGYDKTPTELTSELQAEGIDVHFSDDIALLPDFLSGNGVNPEALVIYTPAIPQDHSQKNALAARGYQLYKRSQVLGMLTRTSKTVAVAGTHGKTTTSTMIAHILKSSGVDCTAFLGGISRNYNTNLLLGSGNPETEWIVVEADEYDRSFLTLHPKVAVVTSLDADHLDIYGNRESMIESYSQFASQTDPDGRLIKRAGLELGNVKAASWTYGIDSGSDFAAADVRVEQSAYVFDVYAGREHLGQFRMNWPGRHNVENALGAIAACTAAGVDPVQIKSALESFTGVKRRFDYRVKSDETVYIDDYAHHPEELRATIESVKELYPGKRIMGIFQPHLYTRTRDFADGFGTSLSLLDEVLLMDIYPARELPIPGVTSGMILEKITTTNKSLCSRDEIVSRVTSTDAPVILTLGAGDIDQLVEPITRALTNKFNVQPA